MNPAQASPSEDLQAISVLADVAANAQVLGESELQSHPGFQHVLR